MLKFKFLLWALTKLLQKAVRNKPGCASYITGKQLIFQIRTHDGIGRYFTVKNGEITSSAGVTRNPQFTLSFRNAAKGFAILSAKDGKDAFLTGLRTEDLVVSGDFVEVMWFQGLTEYLQPGERPQKPADVLM
ncbi:helicase [Pseudomonas sp. RGM2987]|uniref:helicase n=1 Tax=Pseudomonas sp. RGM2987 TaxID=2930090 RepID=UPI001FD6813B|nr:helicase [Pseudomonas sp. RGM2987]MCJ8206740.1 helicase [Pseudomonas sp. RGM2987]